MASSTKSKKRKTADKAAGGLERKNLASLMFEECARRVIADQAAKLPATFTPEELAREVHSYLDHAGMQIRLPYSKVKLQVKAMDLGNYFRPPYVGEGWELLDQADFRRWAEPLLLDGTFQILEEPIRLLRKRAGELHLNWKTAEFIIRNVVNELRPDARPLKVRRGEVRARVVSELRQIKARRAEFRGFEDLKGKFPNFKILEIVSGPPFEDDFRDYLASPGRWETKPATFAHGILKTYWGLSSEETLKSYRKAYNRSQKFAAGAVSIVRLKH